MTTKKSRKQATGGTEKRSPKRKTASGPVAPTVADVGAGAKKTAKAGTSAKGRKTSALNAAAQVLAEANEPLSTGEIVKRMLERGLWQTRGRTPQATLYSALLRRIQKDGANARFRKVERGRFELVK